MWSDTRKPRFVGRLSDRSVVRCRVSLLTALCAAWLSSAGADASDDAPTRTYENRLTPILDPLPVLSDHPRFVAPLVDTRHFEAPPLLDEAEADLFVRAWRYSFNVRGAIEMPNRLSGKRTAVVVVHPWGIDDGQGWKVPQPAGFAFGSPEKNAIYAEHLRDVVNPFLETIRPRVGLVLYSLRGGADPIRTKLYRSIHGRPPGDERAAARKSLEETLARFDYRAGGVPQTLVLSPDRPVADYFRQLPGGGHGDHFNGKGYWNLPVPVHSAIEVHDDDVVAFDDDGYAALADFLKENGIRHVLLAGYSTSKCYCSTPAGYQNLERDFNVFLVGDATLETPSVGLSPAPSTTAILAEASREHLITQISWIRSTDSPVARSAQE